MKNHLKEVKYFLFGQHFSEGLRITFAILLPSLVLSYFNLLQTGLALSLGALCVSITDAPGPLVHRKNGMFYCILVILITTFITGFARLNVWVLGCEIVAGAFLFSMFNVYGVRAAAIGTAGLLVMILNMDKPLTGQQVFVNALLIAGGGLWYMCVSLFFFALKPYRLAQRLLGDCIRETAAFLSIKANFYNTGSDLEEGYNQLVVQQMVVHEKQDAVREILFKTEQTAKESTPHGRALVRAFIESVDLFEDSTSTYYDYSIIRKRYAHTGMLDEIAELIQALAKELDNIGVAIQSNTTYKSKINLEDKFATLRAKIDTVAIEEKEGNTFVLKKIVVNVRKLVMRIGHLGDYTGDKQYTLPIKKTKTEHHRFVDHQSFSVKVLTENLGFDSAVFRYSVRTAVVCFIGFVLSKTLLSGEHSYWILLTIAFVMKPAYSLTKERNVQRIIGTLGGGLTGFLILFLVRDGAALLFLLVLFMLGTYSFLRVNYLVMVSCVTPLVIILFHFLGLGYISIVQERILDTVIGCAIAFTASYLLLPSWEGEQLSGVFNGMLLANLGYLQIVSKNLWGQQVSITDYKLARKEVYVHTANLSAAYQRMLSEPKTKQKKTKLVHQFVVLNHILFSNIAAVASTLQQREIRTYPNELLDLVNLSVYTLKKAVIHPGENPEAPEGNQPGKSDAVFGQTSDDRLLKEQLLFIQNVTSDIEKTTRYISR